MGFWVCVVWFLGFGWGGWGWFWVGVCFGFAVERFALGILLVVCGFVVFGLGGLVIGLGICCMIVLRCCGWFWMDGLCLWVLLGGVFYWLGLVFEVGLSVLVTVCGFVGFVDLLLWWVGVWCCVGVVLLFVFWFLLWICSGGLVWVLVVWFVWVVCLLGVVVWHDMFGFIFITVVVFGCLGCLFGGVCLVVVVLRWSLGFCCLVLLVGGLFMLCLFCFVGCCVVELIDFCWVCGLGGC